MQKPIRAFLAASEAMPKEAEMPVCSVCVCPAVLWNLKKLKFIADAIETYHIKRVHLTTCQTLQLHDLDEETVKILAVEALKCGIVTRGGGGDFPRNVTVSPLSGIENGEYFNVLPWALAAADYLMTYIKGPKLPRKLKVGFSNTPANLTHATFRDLGFAAREDGTFDVYSAGGLGNNPAFAVKVAEKVEKDQILYYIEAMHQMFLTYGNYENRAKARSRYMQQTLGGAEKYKEAFLGEVKRSAGNGKEPDFTLPEAEVGCDASTAVFTNSGRNRVYSPETARALQCTLPSGRRNTRSIFICKLIQGYL